MKQYIRKSKTSRLIVISFLLLTAVLTASPICTPSIGPAAWMGSAAAALNSVQGGAFSNLSANMPLGGPAVFSFSFSGNSPSFTIDASTSPTMATDVYLGFASGPSSPINVNNPASRWDKYSCARTLYWVVKSSSGVVSPIQSTTINNCGTFSNLSASIPLGGPAVFSFSFSSTSTGFTIDASTSPTMATDVYLGFASGTTSPLSVNSPAGRWDKYSCGRTLYWQVKSSTGVLSPIQSTAVNNCGAFFSNLSASMTLAGPAIFNFSYGSSSTGFTIDASTSPTMASDVFLGFASGASSPLNLNNPASRWDKYSCGRTLYWVVKSSSGVVSPIQNTTISNCGIFSNLSASMPFGGPASFSFNFSASSTNFTVDASTSPTMASDVYLGFASGTTSPLSVNNPAGRWDKYSCGRTLYWVVKSNTGVVSPIQSTTVNDCANDPARFGKWSAIVDWPQMAIHLSVLPDGRLLSWQDDNNPGYPPARLDNRTEAYIVNVSTGASTPVFLENRTNVFCAGHSFLADGRLLIAGGHDAADNVGEPHTNIFDSTLANPWVPQQNMNAGRWYPTTCTLANGDVVVAAGSISGGPNSLPQVFSPGAGWRDLSNAMLSLPLYPFLHLAPNGKVFVSGPAQTSRYLDTSGTGQWTTVANSSRADRTYGSSVMYDDGKVLITGGGFNPPTNSTEVIDLNAATPAWRTVSAMNLARTLHNSTLLPDGTVLVTGGQSTGGFNDGANAAMAAETWDPATEKWSLMASMQVKRIYHSTAVLLPDGRVLSAGGGRPAALTDTDHRNAEIFSPPYLFKGARPTINSAPSNVTYGQQFTVGTPDSASIAKVTWIRLSSVTHSFNMNQRINQLGFSVAAGGLNVIAPSNRNLCPPGHYMLFILNGNGVPSVAKIVRIN